MKYIIAVLALVSTTAWSAPSVRTLESVWVGDTSMIITDRDHTTWVVEQSCDLMLGPDAGRAKITSRAPVLRVGSTYRVSIDTGESHRCRVVSLEQLDSEIIAASQE